jgi:peptidyl-prolyl cis-trans isomerase C
MKLSRVLSSLILTASIALAASTTLATVNGNAITTTDASAFMSKAIPGMTFDKLDPKMKRQVVDQLVNQQLIKDQVAKSGIQNTPQFKLAYEALRDDLAVDMWMKQQMAKITVSDQEAKTFYDNNKEKMKQNNKIVPYDKAKFEITQFIKMEKFKAQMTKTTESLRAASKVEVKL